MRIFQLDITRFLKRRIDAVSFVRRATWQVIFPEAAAETWRRLSPTIHQNWIMQQKQKQQQTNPNSEPLRPRLLFCFPFFNKDTFLQGWKRNQGDGCVYFLCLIFISFSRSAVGSHRKTLSLRLEHSKS